MADLLVYIPNHGYSISDFIFYSPLDINVFVRDPDNDPSIDADSFKISTDDSDDNLIQFAETVTDGFVRKVDVTGGITTITGLEHLEGETVKVTSGGLVVATETVSNGSVSVSNSVFAYAVGKTYEATLVPMDLDIQGTGLSTTKRPNRVIINLHETIGGKIGQDVNSLENIPNTSTLTTDYREVSLQGGYTRDTDVVVKQDQPLPMTVLSLTYDLGASRD